MLIRWLADGPTLFPRITDRTVGMECLVIHAPAKNAVRQMFRTVFRSRSKSGVEGQFAFVSTKIAITSPLNRPFTLDGELVDPTEDGTVELKMGPTIEFVSP